VQKHKKALKQRPRGIREKSACARKEKKVGQQIEEDERKKKLYKKCIRRQERNGVKNEEVSAARKRMDLRVKGQENKKKAVLLRVCAASDGAEGSKGQGEDGCLAGPKGNQKNSLKVKGAV